MRFSRAPVITVRCLPAWKCVQTQSGKIHRFTVSATAQCKANSFGRGKVTPRCPSGFEQGELAGHGSKDSSV